MEHNLKVRSQSQHWVLHLLVGIWRKYCICVSKDLGQLGHDAMLLG